jgi:hypothetical protein
MRPQWYEFKDIPYGSMWPDDRFWLPKVLAGKCVKGRFAFGPGDTILEQHLEEI